ncbi:MAG: HNH endonuclease [Solobacterium sp.]|nr:HNH endonuclease [Solobacterium sp.]MDY2952724.1 HNH endonuclease [Erysipelotrichaceae bacterium]
MNKTSNRGKRTSEKTKMLLIARAGGRCQFKGCNRDLFIDEFTLEKFNFSNMAHIIASSPNGPRGNDDSHKLSDDIDNLMLLCPEHHNMIDKYPEKYPTEKLVEMKTEQELKVAKLLDEMYFPESEIIAFEAKIKNIDDVSVDTKLACEAMRQKGYKPAITNKRAIKIDSSYGYKSPDYWKDVNHALEQKFHSTIEGVFSSEPNTMFSVFPLAPIPLIIKFGYLFGDKKTIDIYQKFREPNSWSWQSEDETNKFEVRKITRNDNKKIAVILSVSSVIDIDRIVEVDDFGIVYHLQAKECSVNAIKSLKDLECFWLEYLNLLDEIKNNDKVLEFSLFPAVPVSAAFMVGSKYMKGIHPKIRIYDDYKGFFETLVIGGNND